MKQRLPAVALSILSALLLVAAHPPFSVGLLALVGFVPLFFALEGVGRREGFLLGLLSGFVFYLGTVYWVVYSMNHFGGVEVWISVPVMLLLAVYLGIYTGLFALFTSSVAASLAPVLRLLVVPAAWVSLEYLRGYLFTGFPWALLGYTQIPYLPVIQVADITGVWGLSYLVMSVNTVIFLYIRPVPAGGRRPVLKAAILVSCLVVLTLAYGFFRINQVDSEIPSWPVLNVGVAQGSIDQSIKWDADYQKKTVDIYGELSAVAAAKGARLVVWPETAMPYFFEAEEQKSARVFEIAKETGSYILTGSLAYNYNPEVAGRGKAGAGAAERLSYFNSAYLVSPEGKIIDRYDKFHLVPFGEYVPLKRFFPFIKKMTAGVGEFSEGPGAVPLSFEEVEFGTLICYEAIFPEISREFVKRGATLLVNITNDAWFGRTSAPHQHFEMSIMRAVENKVFLVRGANTGISAVVDPVGRILKRTPLFEQASFSSEVRLRGDSPTLYTVWGDIFAYVCLIVSAVVVIRGDKRRR